MLETERILLRKFEKDDAKEILSFINSEFVMKYNIFEAYNEGRLWKASESGLDYVIIHKEDAKIIGMIGIQDDPFRKNTDVVSLTYMLDEPYTHKGYMREALREILEIVFEEMHKPMISLVIAKQNMDSRKLADSLGFRLEGIVRRAIKRYDGKVFDECLYSLTRQEFEENLEI